MSANKSEGRPVNVLARKLADVAAEVRYVQKDSFNDFQKYKYASAEAVLGKVNEALTTRGIAVGSTAELVNYHHGGKGESHNAVVRLTLRFIDCESNEVIAVQGLGQGSDKGDKAVMKANTAALKYCYANAFTISWGDDPEVPNDSDKVDAGNKKRRAKNKKSPAAGNGFKTVFTREELESKITDTTTKAELEAVKGAIVTMRGTDDYKPLVALYKDRLKALPPKEL